MAPRAEKRKRRKRTYWDKYPQLRLMKALGKRRLISFMFFSYVFLFTSAESTNTMKFRHEGLLAHFSVTVLIVLSVFLFDHGINTCRGVYLVPFMSITISALTLFIVMSGYLVNAIIEIPEGEHLLLAFHLYIFGITAAVSLMLAKGIDVMWQGIFQLGELSQEQELVEKLRTNAPLEDQKPESESEQRKRRKSNVVRRIIIERVRCRYRF